MPWPRWQTVRAQGRRYEVEQMQILSRSILRRRPGVSTLPAPMHRFSSPSRLRPLCSFMASASPRCWPQAVARRTVPLMVDPNQPAARRVSRDRLSMLFGDRFPHASRNMASSTGGKDLEAVKPVISSSNDIMTPLPEHSAKEFIACYDDGRPAHGEENWMSPKKEDGKRTNMNIIYGDEDARRTTLETTGVKPHREEITDIKTAEDMVVSDDDEYTDCGVLYLRELPCCTHRDGSIYMNDYSWKKDFLIADRDETQLEAMMQSRLTERCVVVNGRCKYHRSRRMLQFFSVKLHKIHGDGVPVELYGYIAVRDDLEGLINYLVNFSRDDPIVVEQGSLIITTGPKRGIDYLGELLFEYDMRIKIGEQENDDLQLIDGASPLSEWEMSHCRLSKLRIHGDYGTVDITGCQLDDAVEATVEVIISEVRSSFNLCLGCFTSGMRKEIRLFDGTIGEPHVLKQSVVGVVMGTQMDLKFKIGTGHDEHCCSFYPSVHGYATQEMKTDSALISVKVTWSTLIGGWPAEHWDKKAV